MRSLTLPTSSTHTACKFIFFVRFFSYFLSCLTADAGRWKLEKTCATLKLHRHRSVKAYCVTCNLRFRKTHTRIQLRCNVLVLSAQFLRCATIRRKCSTGHAVQMFELNWFWIFFFLRRHLFRVHTIDRNIGGIWPKMHAQQQKSTKRNEKWKIYFAKNGFRNRCEFNCFDLILNIERRTKWKPAEAINLFEPETGIKTQKSSFSLLHSDSTMLYMLKLKRRRLLTLLRLAKRYFFFKIILANFSANTPHVTQFSINQSPSTELRLKNHFVHWLSTAVFFCSSLFIIIFICISALRCQNDRLIHRQMDRRKSTKKMINFSHR